jgi:ubiquinone/menaquinone biosynthesis C-methylase UbiE
MDYIKDTKDAYKTKTKAKAYQEQYTKGFKWARFTMWRQRLIIKRIINKSNFNGNDKILDIPCGAGFIGKILCDTPALITASDISSEMIKRAAGEYVGENFQGFVECDITQTPFKTEYFDCVIILAFMHRLSKEIRDETWKEILRISKKYIIVNYGFDTLPQRLKKRLLKKISSNYLPAPSSISMQDIIAEINSLGLKIISITNVVYFFSGKVIFFLGKK